MESWPGSTVKKTFVIKRKFNIQLCTLESFLSRRTGKILLGGEVNLKNVLMRRRARKDLSAEHKVAGIVARMEATLYRTGKMSWRPF